MINPKVTTEEPKKKSTFFQTLSKLTKSPAETRRTKIMAAAFDDKTKPTVNSFGLRSDDFYTRKMISPAGPLTDKEKVKVLERQRKADPLTKMSLIANPQGNRCWW